MEAIGAAHTTSTAARSTATPAGAANLRPSGGAVTPAGVVAPEPIVTTTRIRPTSIELTTVQGSELIGVQSLVQRAGLPIDVTASQPSADELIREVATEQRSGRSTPKQSLVLQAQIDGLMADLLAGRGDPAELIRVLDALRQLVKVVQRSEDRRDLLKDLLIKAMLGAVTPQMLKRAKALGLEEVVKAVIVDAVKHGHITKAAAQPLALALRAAGIVVPELDILVDDLRSSELREQERVVDHARRGEELLAADPLDPSTGNAPIVAAQAGLRAFQ